MIRDLPAGSYWALAGVGDAQLQVNSEAIASDGGVRVGLEDNIWYDAQRTRLATNADSDSASRRCGEGQRKKGHPAGSDEEALASWQT